MQLHKVQAQAKLGQRSSAGRRSLAATCTSGRHAAPSLALRSAIVPAMQLPGVQSNRPQVVLSATTTKVSLGTLSVKAALKPDSSSIVVLGSQGEAGAKLARALLEAGFKVTAGVDFPEQAKATVAFAKRYELLSRQQLSNLKLAEADDALPSRSRVVIIEGDALGDKKVDERYIRQALQRAEAAGASQVVLVTTSSGSSGGFFSFGASPNQPNRSLTRIEQLAAGSDVPVTVVRASTSDSKVAPDAETKVVSGPGSLAPATAPVSADMLAEVLGAVLTQPAAPAGVPVVLEVAAVPAGQGQSLADAVAKAVEEAKDKAPAPKAAAAPKAAPAKSAAPAFALPAALGTIGVSVRKAAAKQEEEEEEAPQRKPFGSQKVAARPAPAKRAPVEDEDEEEEKEKPLGFLAGLFGGNTGTQRVSVKPAASAAPARPGTQGVRVGTQGVRVGGTTKSGTTSVSAKAAPAPAAAQRRPNPFSSIKRDSPAPAPQTASNTVIKAAPAKASPAPAPAKPASKPLFGFFAVNPASAREDEEEAPSRPAPRAAPAKPAPKPAPRPTPVAARGRTAAPEPLVAKPSSNNFFASLFGGKRKSEEDEDDEPVRPAARRATPPPPPKPAPKPAPVKAAPAKAATTSSSAQAAPARSSNPFSSIKRVAPPPQPAAPAKPAPKAGTTKTQAAPAKPGTTKVQAKPAPSTSGTSIRGTYRPVSGFSVEPKKK